MADFIFWTPKHAERILKLNCIFFRMVIRYHRHVRPVLLLGRIIHCVKRRIVVSDAFDRFVPKVSKQIQRSNYRHGFQYDKQCVKIYQYLIEGTRRKELETEKEPSNILSRCREILQHRLRKLPRAHLNFVTVSFRDAIFELFKPAVVYFVVINIVKSKHPCGVFIDFP